MKLTLNQALQSQACSSPELQRLTGYSQPSISRQLQQLGSALLRTGQGRHTRYYLRRALPGLQASELPLYRISEIGHASLLGQLIPVYPYGYLLRDESHSLTYHPGLPWWLVDMRPQGFIGRNFARQHGLAANPDDWSDDDALRALYHYPHDPSGNLLIGDISYQHWLESPNRPLDESELEQLAEQTLQGEVVGSSAGGEQPKLAGYLQGEAVLIKFSARLSSSAQARRWAQLLRAEHLAATLLREAGLPACQTRLLNRSDRQYLLISRFDRQGKTGRLGLISLRTMDAEFIGEALSGWPVLVERLVAEGQVTPESQQIATLAWCFGVLIANTDMHLGNLSFLDQGRMPLKLAPIYDMLPMAFAPNRSGHMPDQHRIQLSLNIGGQYWRQMLPWALNFWQQLAEQAADDAEFQAIAQQMHRQLTDLSPQIQRMA